MTFTYKLEHEDGTSADPRTFKTAVPTWRPGLPQTPRRTECRTAGAPWATGL
jgi:hypothetical protein